MADPTPAPVAGTPATVPAPASTGSAVATPPAAPVAGISDATAVTPAAPVPPVDPAAPAVPAPEFKLNLPEGFAADETTEKFIALAKADGLKAEQAQKVFDLYVGAEKARAEKVAANREATLSKWTESLRSDKEYGGVKYDATLAAAAATLKQFGTPELAGLMDQTGLGSHPEMIKAFAKVGALLRQDSLGSTPGTPKQTLTNEEHFKASFPKTYADLKGS